MKSGIRIAAAASGPIGGRKSALLVIVVYREGTLEGVLSGSIGVDLSDSGRKIASIISRSRFGDQVKLLALNGIALAGLNVVDVNAVKKALKANFLILTRKKPHKELLIEAIGKREGVGTARKSEASRKKHIVEAISNLPILRYAGFYVQSDLDINKENKDIIRASFEALRIAHLIANGIITGESKGRI